MDPPLELVQFVTRSENRLTALFALSSQAYTRPELQEETGVPRATLSRILADFQRRELATRDGHRHSLTPLGALVASQLQSLLDSIESMQGVQTLTPWLALDDIRTDLDGLAGAEVTLPTRFDPMTPVKRAATVVGEASYVRTFCYSVVHAPILAELRAITEAGQQFEAVVAAGVLQVVAADPELASAARELIEAGNADVSVYEGSIEPQLIVADRTTMFLVTDDEGTIQGLVSIDEESVLSWAEETFESIKRDAEPLTSDRVAELLTT